MPRRRSRRKRVSVMAWSVLGWICLAGTFFACLLLSPLTSLRTVRAVGFLPEDKAGLERVVQPLSKIPWLKLDREQMRTAILRNQDFESVQVEANVFGRGLVKVTRRKPVAIINSSAKILLSDRGEIYRTSQALPIAGKITLPANALGVGGTLMGSWDSGKIAELCADLRDKVPNLPWNVEVDPRSVITLRAEGAPTIILGGSDDLDKKIARLVDIFNKKPDLIRTAKEINLTAPDEPVYRTK